MVCGVRLFEKDDVSAAGSAFPYLYIASYVRHSRHTIYCWIADKRNENQMAVAGRILLWFIHLFNKNVT